MDKIIKITWDKGVQDLTSIVTCIKSVEVEENTMFYCFSEVCDTVEKGSMLYRTLEEYFTYHYKPILVISEE